MVQQDTLSLIKTDLDSGIYSSCNINQSSLALFYHTSFPRDTDEENQVQNFPFSFLNYPDKPHFSFWQTKETDLREGIMIEENTLKTDWMLPVILVSAALYIILRNIPGNYFRSMLNFLIFRDISGPASRETARIFRLQSTTINLASLLNVGLFGYSALWYFDISTPGLHGITLWLACTAVAATAMTVRFIVSSITGTISEKPDIFSVYMVTVYNFYRIWGLVCFILLIMMIYTSFLSPGVIVFSGIIAGILLYIIRIVRLLLIFITRRASVLYLILYLCALEILPVAVIIKYITGLFQDL